MLGDSRSTNTVPRFALYGEPATGDTGPLLHIEPIRQRSRPRGWQIPEHAHDDLLQAVLVRSGWVELHMDGRNALVRGPAILCVPPGVVHAYRFDPKIAGDVLSVSRSLLAASEGPVVASLAETLHSGPLLLPLSPRDLREIAPLLAQIRAEAVTRRAGQAAMLGWLARCLLLWLQRFRANERQQSLPIRPATARLLRFRQLVEREFRAQRAVGYYARTLGMTERSLRRLCHDQAGVAPGRIVDERLALEARRRLLFTHEPVASIGYDLGFDDPAYFSRFMRRLTGESPQALRLSAGTSAGPRVPSETARHPVP